MRVDLPGGHYIDLRDLSGLNRDHQDDWADLQAEIREKKEASLPPAPEPAPVNPAVMPDPAARPPVVLTRKDVRPLHDQLLEWVVQGTSYGYELPWTAETSRLLPLPDWNALIDALDPYFDALNGIVPKSGPTPAGTGT